MSLQNTFLDCANFSFQTTTTYLLDWLQQRDIFVEEIVECAAPPSAALCSLCESPMKWRCNDCFASPCYCTSCCRSVHERSPFHRVVKWNGQTFYKSSLRRTGLTLYLGHGGLPCPDMLQTTLDSSRTTPSSTRNGTPSPSVTHSPLLPHVPLPSAETADSGSDTRLESYMDLFQDDDSAHSLDPFDLSAFGNILATSEPRLLSPSPPPSSPTLPSQQSPELSSPSISPNHHSAIDSTTSSAPLTENAADDTHIPTLDDDDESDDEGMEFETGGISTSALQYPKGRDGNNNPWITIVDITGVHHLPIHFCQCSSPAARHIQLLRLGLYPVSYDRPRTVFTFRVLDDFNLDNLETKSAAQRYYAKLIRLTSNSFPQSVPNRYREFMRVIREWRNIKSRKHAGIFGKDAGQKIAAGGLVSFCPACPQPGVNLPEDWKDDSDQ